MMLSVVMPIARIDGFLRETLLSVASQTFKDFELIAVCDSNLRDDLEVIFNGLSLDFSYKIIHTKLKGVAFAANLGIAESRATYLARWDSDDLCDPHRFERQIAEFETDKSLGVIGTKVVIIGEDGIPSEFQKFRFYGDNKSIRRALKFRQPLLHSSLMFRSEIVFKNKGYIYGHTSEDHEMFIRIARDPSVVFKNLNDVQTYYRRHSAQLSDVGNQKRHFCEISGFMFTEFLMTLNPLYVFGMLVNFPPFRRLRYGYRSIRQFLKKA